VDWQEFRDRIPGGVSSQEEPRARGCLQDACILVREVADNTYEAEAPPDIVVMVAIGSARRAFINPDGVVASGIDGYDRRFAVSSANPDIYITQREADAIRRKVGRAGVWALGVSRGDIADVPSPSGPIPVLSPPAAAEYDPFGESWPP
jgi:hypothetical protein